MATGSIPNIEMSVNIARRLSAAAAERPDAIAVAMPTQRAVSGRNAYRQITFADLEADSNRLAAGLRAMGVERDQRIVLMVPPSIDFISLTFALFKVGAVIVLIDPGMGRSNLLQCLESVRPDGFVAIPIVHAIRSALRYRFRRATKNVTVGRRWFWGGKTVSGLRRCAGSLSGPAPTSASDAAAIIFTTGSTGPPKGVLYSHGNFDSQVVQIRDRYDIRPGEVDLPGFPLFGLFNAAMGVTTVLPEMDPTRPAQVDPRKILRAVNEWQVTQSFGSPAIWNVVGRHCEETGEGMPTLRRVLSAGAPVPPHVLRRMKLAMAGDGDVFTPYGATEALPVASISASEVLSETSAASARGAGTCVGSRFSGIQWMVIEIQDGPIRTLDEARQVPPGEMGELIVRGPVVTSQYVTRQEENATAKIVDGEGFWHRMGDVGYLDERDRFWFCGRKTHRVRTSPDQTMYTVCCEAIANQHPHIYRSALVGVGPELRKTPALIVEPLREHFPNDETSRAELLRQVSELTLKADLTAKIRPENLLVHQSLPVDIRHNAKIFREKLAIWAEEQIRL